MYKVLILGGTTEGRTLYEFTREREIPALTCVATDYGAELLGANVRVGRLDRSAMAELIRTKGPALVIDATHPYALDVSRNARDACEDTGAEYLRIAREGDGTGESVGTLEELVNLLKATDGVIFSTLGAKEAEALTALPDYRERVWLRILPSMESLSHCLSLGYAPKRIICMQGPFSKDLNASMLRETGAKILVTKESGASGGFSEKVEAAAELGVRVFALGRPDDDGVSVDDAKRRLAAL